MGIYITMAIQAQPTESAAAQQIRPINQDEASVPAYVLPDPLQLPSGERLSDPSAWEMQRGLLVDRLAEVEYGRMPTDQVDVRMQEWERGETPNGKSERRQYRLTLARQDKTHQIDVILFLPRHTTSPVPCFLALNFRGNHGMTSDPQVRLPESWLPDGEGVVEHRATEAGRNLAEHRWPIDDITARGYGLVSAYYGDIDPDFDDGFANGVHALFPDWRSSEEHPDRWGSIAAWAWGLSRMADGLVSIPEVDANQMMVVGHSRLGKTALWAGANDTRFKLVYSNNSGCGGAALSKRIFGESVARINTSFPHWFCRNFRQYNDREEQLPLDQHWLIASIAPRPVYIASASEDLWADPKGEYLSGHYASPVYRLLGKKGLENPEMPESNGNIGEDIGFHLRPGKHDLTPYDWNYFMDFADRHRHSDKDKGGNHGR